MSIEQKLNGIVLSELGEIRYSSFQIPSLVDKQQKYGAKEAMTRGVPSKTFTWINVQLSKVQALIKRMSELLCNNITLMIKSSLDRIAVLVPPPPEPRLIQTMNEGAQHPRGRKDSDQQSFEPEFHQIKKLGLKVNKKRYSAGSWSSSQNYIYYCFMRSNYNDFLTEKERRRCKVFFRLSQILKRRTPDQCRSHHQKLQLKFNDDLPTIMNEVNKKIQKSLAEEMVNNQYHIQRMQMEHMSQMGSNSALDLKIVAQESWYTIRFNNLVTRIEINEENISEW